MTPRAATLALATLGALLVAGCSDGGAPAASDGLPDAGELGLEATSTTGVVRGVVVDEAIRPLAGAEVRLAAEPERSAATTAEGLFGFDGLPPGTYVLRVAKPGYLAAQQSVEVLAGVGNPPAVKVLLAADASYQPFVEAQVYEGFIECTTSVLVLCGAPNAIEPLMCEGAEPLPPVCYGNLTNDRFTFTLFFAPDTEMVQTELVWTTNQPLSPDLYIEAEALTPDCPNTDLSTTLNGTRGPSPLLVRFHRDVLEEYEIGPACGIYFSVFSGDATGDPAGQGVPVGFTVEQRFTAYTHAFHGYLPPADWRFSTESAVPAPPS